jgi:hypothetical protein
MFVDAAPKATREMVPGNHDWRVVQGFAWSHPEFDGDDVVSLPKILRLEEFKIAWHAKPAAIFLAGRNFVVTHGVRLASNSGGSANLELNQEWWMSGLSGHSHRMGTIFRTTARGIHCWTEGGHLQHRTPKYAPINKVAPYNWQQGMTVMFADRNEFRLPSLIPFWPKARRLRARYEDQEFTA